MELVIAAYHVVSAHSILGAAIVVILLLIYLLIRSFYRRHERAVAPLMAWFQNIGNLEIEKSLSRRLELIRHGPEWGSVAKCIEESASFFVTGVPKDCKGANRRALFDFYGTPETAYGKRSPRPKICVFFCQGIRPKITWIDYMYLRLLYELREQGAHILILLHNDQFDKDSMEYYRPRHTSSNSIGLQSLRANVTQLFGADFAKTINLGKEYLTGNGRLMKKYIEFIYDDVAALYVNGSNSGQIPGKIPSASEFANTISGFACSSLRSEKRFVLYLGWEQQTNKWTSGPLSKLSATLCDGFVVGTTIAKEAGGRVDVYSSNSILNLFDNDDEIAGKLFGVASSAGGSDIFFTDLTTVRNVCVGLLRLKAEDWEYETMVPKTAPTEIKAKWANCQRILGKHGSVLHKSLQQFVALTPLPEALDKDLGDEVCARCAAYAGLVNLRDAVKISG